MAETGLQNGMSIDEITRRAAERANSLLDELEGLRSQVSD